MSLDPAVEYAQRVKAGMRRRVGKILDAASTIGNHGTNAPQFRRVGVPGTSEPENAVRLLGFQPRTNGKVFILEAGGVRLMLPVEDDAVDRYQLGRDLYLVGDARIAGANGVVYEFKNDPEQSQEGFFRLYGGTIRFYNNIAADQVMVTIWGTDGKIDTAGEVECQTLDVQGSAQIGGRTLAASEGTVYHDTHDTSSPTTATNASTSSFVEFYDRSITLPGGGSATWDVDVLALGIFKNNGAGNGADMRIKGTTTSNTQGDTAPTANSPIFLTVATVLTGVSDAISVGIEYRAKTGGTASGILAGHVVAARRRT